MALGAIDPSEDGTRHSTDILGRIATALGEQGTVFTGGAASRTDLVDTYELLRIWHGLERAADRRKVLAFARSLIAQD